MWQEKGFERTELPNWLSAREPYSSSCENIDRQHHYVEDTLNNIARLLERSIFSEKYASQSGLLQHIDPRVKVISLFSFIIAVSLFQNIYAILAVYGIILILAGLSNISLGFFLKRVWIFIPLFAGVIAIPSIFNIFTPGDSIVTFVQHDQVQNFWGFEYTEISITQQGVIGAILFTFRVATSVSIVVLLTITTHWAEIMKSLRVLGVPQIFILVLSMTYQYVVLLTRLIQDMHMAKKARTIPHRKIRGSIKGERRWIASRMGMIFQKSHSMIDEVHSAMIARGFRGEIQILHPFLLRWTDFMWMLSATAILIGVIWLNLL